MRKCCLPLSGPLESWAYRPGVLTRWVTPKLTVILLTCRGSEGESSVNRLTAINEIIPWWEINLSLEVLKALSGAGQGWEHTKKKSCTFLSLWPVLRCFKNGAKDNRRNNVSMERSRVAQIRSHFFLLIQFNQPHFLIKMFTVLDYLRDLLC